jgi:hypothetical protein
LREVSEVSMRAGADCFTPMRSATSSWVRPARRRASSRTSRAARDAGPTGYLASRLNAVQHGILSRFTVLPWYARRRTELASRALVQRQACGDAFSAPKLEALARYETHLDRKLERVLGVLIKLRELRPSAARIRAVPAGTASGGPDR